MDVIFDSLPMGLCPECLERMTNFAFYDGYKFPDGTQLVKAYCDHRKAGALGIIRPGKPVRWKIEIPIDAIAWEKSISVRADALAQLFGALDGLQGAAPPPQAH